MKYNRKQYMNKECSHNEYYGQFVDASVLHFVRNIIGEKRIKNSKDEHFNDIPLKDWDALNPGIRHMCGFSLSESNASTCADNVTKGGVSLSDTVCVAKAAAKQIRDE